MSPEDNLYRPPTADVGVSPSSVGPLYSPGQVAGATFLGSPIAGCWLLAANFRELGKFDARRNTLLAGALATIAVMVLALTLPDNFPNLVLPLAYTIALRQTAEWLQGPDFRLHLAEPGSKHSNWRVVGIGVGWMIIFVVVMFGIVLVLPESLLPSL